ncbi:hypothetical protein TNCV_2854001 [Trichonephila clavipes]|uniref:Uncharacterized protein n=1 Tax=Trichonephila clavipes TaxID=2585209 RepID=A0A8X6UR12_TRICX|nr:hypothetical protein TNCV_2854001 [Trichonephila clavipes]
MNQTCFQNVEEGSETNIAGNNSFQWCFFTSSQVNWADIENRVDFLSKEMPDIKIVDNDLFDDTGRLNVHLNCNKLKQLEHQYAEIVASTFQSKQSVKDDERSRRTQTSWITENIEKVSVAVRKNRHQTMTGFPHPPYSPDFTPFDFRITPELARF